MYQDNFFRELAVLPHPLPPGKTRKKAIVERINEMYTRVIKLEGDDFRNEVREAKNKVAKKLGI